MAETTHFRFPLPDPLNFADEDAERIKRALIGADRELHDQSTRLTRTLETADAALRDTRADLGADMEATERRVDAALENQRADLSGRLRRLRLNLLLGLELYE